MLAIDKIIDISPLGRIIAILMIVIFHLFDTIHKLNPLMYHDIVFKITHFGSQGIHFFFFSSAFFLYLKHENISKYNGIFFRWLKERLFKLYPTYITSILLTTFLFNTFDYSAISPLDIFVNLLPLIRNFDSHYIHSINGNFWFLHTLIEFYLFFPLLIYLLQKTTIIRFLILTYLITILYIVFYTFYFSIDSSTLNPLTAFFINYLYDFALGMVLAKYLKNNKTLKLKLSFLLIVFFIFEALGAYLSHMGPFGRNINDILFSIANIIFVLGLSYLIFNVSHIIKTKNNYLKTILNFLSSKVYDVYLVHHPVIKVTLHLVSPHNFTTVAVAFVMVFPVASLSSYLAKSLTKAILQWTK